MKTSSEADSIPFGQRYPQADSHPFGRACPKWTSPHSFGQPPFRWTAPPIENTQSQADKGEKK